MLRAANEPGTDTALIIIAADAAPGPEKSVRRTSTAQHACSMAAIAAVAACIALGAAPPTSARAGAPSGTARPTPPSAARRPRSPTRRSNTRRMASRRRATARCCSRAMSHPAGRADAEDARCQVRQPGAELQRRRRRRVRGPEAEGERHRRARRSGRRRDVRRRGVRAARTATRAAPPTASRSRATASSSSTACATRPARSATKTGADAPATSTSISAPDIGSGRGVRLDFKGVPILYTPFISFPVGNERKSAFCFRRSAPPRAAARRCRVPWYWNIAPNYDATFVPTWFSKRGGKLDTRVSLSDGSFGRGALERRVSARRSASSAIARSLRALRRSVRLHRHLRLDIDAANASDAQWFEDFGLGPEGTSVSYLNRSASLTYLDAALAGGRCARRTSRRSTTIGIPRRAAALHACCRSWRARRLPRPAVRLHLGLDMEVGELRAQLRRPRRNRLRAATWRRKCACRCAARACTSSRRRAGATRPISSTTPTVRAHGRLADRAPRRS